jgi:hypothetical protein
MTGGRDKGVQFTILALSPDEKKVVRLAQASSGSKWTGHRRGISSVCWNRDGLRVVSCVSFDGGCDVEIGEIMVRPIETGVALMETVIYSSDSTLIWTGKNSEGKGFIKV